MADAARLRAVLDEVSEANRAGRALTGAPSVPYLPDTISDSKGLTIISLRRQLDPVRYLDFLKPPHGERRTRC